jgi:hypothetical protein
MDGAKSSGHHSGGRWEIVEKIEGASRDKLLDRINPDASGDLFICEFSSKKTCIRRRHPLLVWLSHTQKQPTCLMAVRICSDY